MQPLASEPGAAWGAHYGKLVMHRHGEVLAVERASASDMPRIFAAAPGVCGYSGERRLGNSADVPLTDGLHACRQLNSVVVANVAIPGGVGLCWDKYGCG